MGLTRMLPSEEKPLPAVGAYWIEEADYPALLKIFDDGNTMPRAWKEWLKMAEEMEKGLKAYGHPVMRVRIDPVSYTHLRAHETDSYLVCRLLLEKKNNRRCNI